MKLFKIILFIFIFLFTQQKIHSEIQIDVRYIILQDHHSGKILYERNADTQIYPASLTKIMTSIVAFDLLKRRDLSRRNDNSFRKSMEIISKWIFLNVYYVE